MAGTSLLAEHSPHEVVDGAVPEDAQREVHRDERVLEVAVHDEVRVGQPDVAVVVDGVEEVVLAVVRVLQPGVQPLLLQQELHLVFLSTESASVQSLIDACSSRFFEPA